MSKAKNYLVIESHAFDKSVLNQRLKDCALDYIRSIGKKEFQFDD